MTERLTQELSCPRCRAPLLRKCALGLRPPVLQPGEFTCCRRCGSVLVMNLDRSLRFAAREEIEDEMRVWPPFRIVVRMAERRRREFIARQSGFTTPATMQRRAARSGGAQ